MIAFKISLKSTDWKTGSIRSSVASTNTNRYYIHELDKKDDEPLFTYGYLFHMHKNYNTTSGRGGTGKLQFS